MFSPGLELEGAGLAGNGDDPAAIDTLGLHAGADEAAKGIIAYPAQPADLQAQARQADGDVGFGAGQAAREVRHGRQVPRFLGNEHRHRLAIGDDVERVPPLNFLLAQFLFPHAASSIRM